ncbi:MAG: prenyltransferase/squalene oxidase repeat-containing protein [Lentisphaeria bacterium]
MEEQPQEKPTKQQTFDPEAILADYQHHKMVENMIGPLISLAIHILLILSILIFYKPKPQIQQASIEMEMKEMKVKELDEKELEKMEELEEIAEEVVPTIERPTVLSDSDAASDVVSSIDDFSDEMAATDDNSMDFSDILDIRESDTPLKISGLYGGRTDAGRKKATHRFGGSARTELAVLKALYWLKKTQHPNGSWAPSYQQAMTGLALLAYLAHGETPASKEFGTTVQKAMQFLIDYMEQASTDPHEHNPYTTGIVTYALSEAYGLTKLPKLKTAMEKALKIIIDGQQKSGGYDYHYKQDARWDLSVAGWQIQAMKAGFVSGANVPQLDKAIERSVHFLKLVCYNKNNTQYPFGYSKPGGGSWGMQGAGALCLQLLGEGHCRAVRHATKSIEKNHLEHVVWNDKDRKISVLSKNPIYAWYYETQVMFHTGQSSWRKWNKMFSNMVLKTQVDDGSYDGHLCGYWPCPPPSEPTGVEKWYTTSLCALSLQVYYRYLPSYKMPKKMAETKPNELNKLDAELGLEL